MNVVYVKGGNKSKSTKGEKRLQKGDIKRLQKGYITQKGYIA